MSEIPNEVPMQTIPEPVILHGIIAWHLLRIAHALTRGEAKFHWRSIKYYRDYWHNSFNPAGTPIQTEKEMVDLLRADGQCQNLVAAIDHHRLLEVD